MQLTAVLCSASNQIVTIPYLLLLANVVPVVLPQVKERTINKRTGEYILYYIHIEMIIHLILLSPVDCSAVSCVAPACPDPIPADIENGICCPKCPVGEEKFM